MKTNNLVNLLKESGQDHEFYPTTNEIVERCYTDLNNISRSEYSAKCFDILEVGCGNGKIFRHFDFLSKRQEEIRKNNDNMRSGYAALGQRYGIEKSEILINQLPAEVVIVGTDFLQQTLIDKQTDVIFCNPPYSEFENWAVKIIKESFTKYIYLVIPQRWENSVEIKSALKLRNASFEILGEYDFLEADRKARAKVHLIKIDLTTKKGYYGNIADASDPFDVWFEEEFKINCDKEGGYSEKQARVKKEDEKRKSSINNEVTAGRDLVQILYGLYQRDLAKLISTYKSLESVDSELLLELNVNLDDVKKALKQKIKGLKHIYWKEIFDRLDKIKERLCKKQRTILLNHLNRNASIDFTPSNVYAVAIWIIKNANKYFDEQLIDLYKELSSKENIKNYKSNKTTWEQDKWRYNQQYKSHYCLDYRLIFSRGGWGWGGRELSESTINLIDDLMTVATNLGFDGQSSQSFGWDKEPKAGEKQEFYMRPNWHNDNTSHRLLFMETRFYKNGNVHLKLNQEFMKALNVEAGRLLGWIKSPQEVMEEFPESYKIKEKDANRYFKKNYLMICNNPVKLLEL